MLTTPFQEEPAAFPARRAPISLSGIATRAMLGLFLSGAVAVLAAPREPWTANRVTGSPNPPPPYRVERLFSNLNFTNPVDIAVLPGSDRILLLEQGGKLFSFPNQAAVRAADLVIDFRGLHDPFDSAYSFAFHPRFAENHLIYVCYVEPGGRPNGSIISRFVVRPGAVPTIDPASEKMILRWLSGGHNGCTLAFGNDGYLYISTGDAANPDPPDMPYQTGQDISDLLAGILRIDIDRTEGTNAYAIPPGNPFRNTPGARPEVYAFGLRNPWRMSFDRTTGDLWVADVGWEQWEMVYRVKPGGNYGWSINEGPNANVRTDVKQGPGPILPPLISLPHSEAASITGGRVYRGRKLGALRNAYLYGDWETGKFWALRNEGDRLVSNDELCDTTLKPVSFAEDPEGELLILDYLGGIYQFVPNHAPGANTAFPRKLSETGLFSDTAAGRPSAGVVGYQINAGMWNDFAKAERLLGIPGSGQIVTANGRETIAGRMWFFPTNTVFARTLSLEMERGSAATARRIETQLLHFDGQTWNAYSYRWNRTQNDADLVPAQGTNDSFLVKDSSAPGGRREVPWRFVGRAECFRCHNAWAGETLSFSWAQLDTPGPSELRRLAEVGVLQIKNPPRPLKRISNPYDADFNLAERARSWLQVNCSPCHRNGAGGGVPSWFNFDLPIEESRAYDAKPVRGDFGLIAARVIAPGDPHRSAILYRTGTEGAGRMPHIGSRLVDEAGVQLLRDWIRSMSPKSEDDAEVRKARQAEEQSGAILKGPAAAAKADLLLSSMNSCLAVAEHLGKGAVSPSANTGGARSTELVALRDAVAAAASVHTNALVRDLFERFLPPEKRRHTLGADFNPQTILSRSGDAVRGKELFLGVSQCARCHTCDGAGRAFGPDLSGISRKYSRAQTLEQILFPSKVIAPEFRALRVTLKDDSELSGFAVQRTDTELVLRDETLLTRSIQLSDIRESNTLPLSLMPEGLLASLTAQEAADLLEYIFSSKAPEGAPAKP